MPASSSSTSAVAMTARLTRPARMQHAVETPAGDSGAASSSAQNRGRGSAPVFIVLQLIAAVDVATPNSLSLSLLLSVLYTISRFLGGCLSAPCRSSSFADLPSVFCRV